MAENVPASLREWCRRLVVGAGWVLVAVFVLTFLHGLFPPNPNECWAPDPGMESWHRIDCPAKVTPFRFDPNAPPLPWSQSQRPYGATPP